MTTPLLADEVPAPLTRHVSDFAHIITPEDHEILVEMLEELRETTGSEGVVVTVPNFKKYQAIDTSQLFYSFVDNWIMERNASEDYFLLLVTQDLGKLDLGFGTKFDRMPQEKLNKVLKNTSDQALVDGISESLVVNTEVIINELVLSEPKTDKSN